MNTIIFSISAVIIITSHLFAISLFQEEKKQIITKPQYQKISMQFAQIEPVKPTIEKKKVVKELVKKETYIKPIEKKAKKQLVKKKKIVKKKITPKKKIIKKSVKKKIVPKKVLKAPIKKVKKSALKDTAQSLKLYKQHKQTYITKLRMAIDKNKKYPRISKRLKEQGVVTISFRVLKNGTFQNIKILKKSAKNRLNKAALNAVLLTKQFDAFTKKLSHKQYLDITLPINFKLY